MSSKLYVGNISYQMDEKILENHFADFGSVKSVKIVTDFETGRSKGFGFVEMENSADAQNCIQNLDGKEFSGRSIKVSLAKEKNERRGQPSRW